MNLTPGRIWTVRILMRCLLCGTEFCQWRPPAAWVVASQPPEFSIDATAAQGFWHCDACGADRVRSVGDVELVDADGG